MAKKKDDQATAQSGKDAKKKKIKPTISGDVNAGEDIPMAEENAHDAQRLPMMIHAQYVKDISFENPNAPFTMLASTGRPEIEVNFNMDARKMDMDKMGIDKDKVDNLYEVVLGVHIEAKKKDAPAYIMEIEYGMSVSLNNVPEGRHHALLLIEMPKYMFPYVRQLVADLSGQGGYMPLMLTPVNFGKFYLQRFGKEAAIKHQQMDHTKDKKEA